MKPKLLIILASTRPGRVGLPVATWFTEHADDDGRFETELVDLAKLALPLLDEPKHPRLRQYTHDHTFAWSRIVDGADAVVIVTAEYNYGYPAALKNALDYLNHEWRHKPLGFVSYGGVAAGTRAVQQLKQVTGAVQLVTDSDRGQHPIRREPAGRRRPAGRQRGDGAGSVGDARRAARAPRRPGAAADARLRPALEAVGGRGRQVA